MFKREIYYKKYINYLNIISKIYARNTNIIRYICLNSYSYSYALLIDHLDNPNLNN